MGNLGKKYRKRKNNERKVVYFLKRHTDKLARILAKVSK